MIKYCLLVIVIYFQVNLAFSQKIEAKILNNSVVGLNKFSTIGKIYDGFFQGKRKFGNDLALELRYNFSSKLFGKIGFGHYKNWSKAEAVFTDKKGGAYSSSAFVNFRYSFLLGRNIKLSDKIALWVNMGPVAVHKPPAESARFETSIRKVADKGLVGVHLNIYGAVGIDFKIGKRHKFSFAAGYNQAFRTVHTYWYDLHAPDGNIYKAKIETSGTAIVFETSYSYLFWFRD